MHHRPSPRNHPSLWLRVSLALAVFIVALCAVPAVALADTYSWGVGADAAFSFDALDTPFSVAADGSLTFQSTGISEGQATFYADSAGFDVPLHGIQGVKKTFDTLTYTWSNDVRGVDLGFFYKTSAQGNWLPIQGTLFEAYAGGSTLWYRVRVTVDTSQPMPSPLTITMIRVTYGDYVPLPKVKGDGKTKKTEHKPTTLGPGVYHYPTQPSGTDSGSGSGTSGGSGSGGISQGGTTGSSGVGLANSAAPSSSASVPSGSLPPPTASAAAGTALIQGYRLVGGDGAVAGATGGDRAAAAGGSAVAGVPSTGGRDAKWGFVLAAALVVALLAAPGPILSRRRQRIVAFDHVRARPHRPYRPLG